MAEQAQDSEHLEGSQKEQAQRHAPLRTLVIHEIVRAEGEAELRRPVSALLWSGLAARLSMAFSYVARKKVRTNRRRLSKTT